MKRSKKNTRVPPDTFRVIKVSQEAVFEFLHECMKDHEELFFDIDDTTSIVTHFAVDWETGSMMMIARNEYDEEIERLQFPEEIDPPRLLSKLPDTVESLYNGEKRYVDMTLDDIIRAQG